jgi:hypothetical protein
MTPTACDSKRFSRPANAIPSPAEIDAMLRGVNAQLIQSDLAPEPLMTAEAAWTIAAVAAGGAVGCLSAGLLIGGWLASLAGATLGVAAGGVFAVSLWRASDGGSLAATNLAFTEDAEDDLLSGW